MKERLLTFIEFLGIPVSRFEKNCGFCNGYVRAIRDGISADKFYVLSKVYPQLNPEWLITGEGEMLRNTAGAVNVDVDMSSGKHTNSPHTEINGDAAAIAVLKAENDALKEKVKSLEADKVKLMNMLDKCLSK